MIYLVHFKNGPFSWWISVDEMPNHNTNKAAFSNPAGVVEKVKGQLYCKW